MPRTRDQSNILNGGQIIKNKSTTEPSLTVTGEWGTDADAEIRLENYEGAVSFANQLRSLDGRLPAPNASISYNLDPAANGNPLAGSRKNDTLEMMITDLNSSNEAKSVLAMEAAGTLKFNGRHLVQLIGNDDPDLDLEIHDFYVTVNGNDDTGDGTQSKPWASPHRAMELIEQVKIDNDAIIEVHIGAGTYIFDKPIVVSHPDGNRIHFIGVDPFDNDANRLAGFPTANWGTTKTQRLNPSGVASPTVNPFVNTAGIQSPETPIDEINILRKNDAISNETKILDSTSGYKTIFKFLSDTAYGLNGFMAEGGYIGYIDNIAIIGDGKGAHIEQSIEAGRYGACGIVSRGHPDPSRTGPGASVALGPNVAIHNFGNCGINATYASVSSGGNYLEEYSGISITGCKKGIIASWGSTAWIPGATIQGCSSIGAHVAYSSSGWFPSINVSGCGEQGIYAQSNSTIALVDGGNSKGNYYGYGADISSSLSGRELVAHGNRSHGVYAQRSSTVTFNSISSIGNGYIGLLSNYNGQIHQHYEPEIYPTGYPNINNNASIGVLSQQNSSIYLKNAYIRNNDGNGVHITSNSFCDLIPRANFPEWTEISGNGNGLAAVTWSGQQSQLLVTHGSTCYCTWNKITQSNAAPAVWATGTGYIYLSHVNQTTYIYGNTQPMVRADNTGFIYAVGITMDSYASADFSPLPGTEGNNNSFILATQG